MEKSPQKGRFPEAGIVPGKYKIGIRAVHDELLGARYDRLCVVHVVSCDGKTYEQCKAEPINLNCDKH
jgi:hypothetical protein